MNMTAVFGSYGRPASFSSKSGEKLAEMSAFISPLRYKNKMYLYGVNTEIGYNSQGHYLYIGPPNPDLTAAEEGAYITCMGEKYRIDRAEKVYKGNDVFYIWAIIRVIVEI
ncbi:MAG: hypothetical protein IJE74_05180 [Clostridia bacterium]|nr:hypothetical protein [Clostridia bacterium]